MSPCSNYFACLVKQDGGQSDWLTSIDPKKMALSFGNVIFYLYLCIMKSKRLSLNYQLGMYVGEYIVALHLPTLSTDMLLTRTIIDVSSEETAEWEELEKPQQIYISSKDPDREAKEEARTKRFYENRKWYHKLEEKYLPETLKIMVPRVVPTNMEQFTQGIKDTLWNCDRSHYWIEDGFFEQTNKYAWCSYVILTRHIEKIPEKFA